MSHFNDTLRQDANEAIVAAEPLLLDLLGAVERAVAAEKERITGGVDAHDFDPNFRQVAQDYFHTRQAIQTLKIFADKGLHNDQMTNTDLVDLINYGHAHCRQEELWPIQNFVKKHEKEMIGAIAPRIQRMPNQSAAERLRLLETIRRSIFNCHERSGEQRTPD